MDVIAVDIGNSTVSVGAFHDDELARTEQFAVEQLDKLPETLKTLRDFCGPQEHGARAVPVVVSSVNTALTEKVDEAAGKALNQRIFLIGDDIPIPIKVAVEEPDKVGTDRLVTAAAAYDMLGEALVVADFGTATTIDCVNHQGIFLGGAILPGLALGAKALHQHTSALPEVEIVVPEGSCGVNTVSAIQHGLYYGALGALRMLVERYAEQFGRWPHVVATGGHAKLVGQRCEIIDSLVDNLCLTGIFLAHLKHSVVSQDDDQAS